MKYFPTMEPAAVFSTTIYSKFGLTVKYSPNAATKSCGQMDVFSVEKLKILKWNKKYEFSYFGRQNQEWTCSNQNI